MSANRLFFSKNAEISVVGLQVRRSLVFPLHLYTDIVCGQASGKTSFVNVIGSGQVHSSATPLILRTQSLTPACGVRRVLVE